MVREETVTLVAVPCACAAETDVSSRQHPMSRDSPACHTALQAVIVPPEAQPEESTLRQEHFEIFWRERSDQSAVGVEDGVGQVALLLLELEDLLLDGVAAIRR